MACSDWFGFAQLSDLGHSVNNVEMTLSDHLGE